MSAGGLLLKRKQKILFEGSSSTSRKMAPAYDTWPYLRLMNWERTWADDFSETLFCLRPDLQLAFRNSAVGGSNIFNTLERFDKCIMPFKPDWVFLTIGINEPHQNISVQRFAQGVDDLVLKLKKVSNPRVVFLGGSTTQADQDSRDYNRVLKRVAKRENHLYVDIRSMLRKKLKQLKQLHEIHTIYSDKKHVNSVGVKIISATVLGAVGFDFKDM